MLQKSQLLSRAVRTINYSFFLPKQELSRNAENFKENPYFEKYADKIAAAKKMSPEELKLKLDRDEIQKSEEPRLKLPEDRAVSTAPSPSSSQKASKLLPKYTKQKSLDSILKVDMIKDKSSKEISQIWLDYHKTRDKISAVLPSDTYTKILESAAKFPTFLYPIPRSNGYEFIMGQFHGEECHFSALINYQAYGENAPACLSLYHFPELQDKGIVLMQGEFDKDTLNVIEAQCLANQVMLYYTASEGEKKYNLLYSFNKKPDEFKYMHLITELENVVI